ncbi:class II aldolase/adducin family protein [Roseicyclus mahoneyensis]|uniref:L-ribulose-5-phosphate 4-epimerase n=1 Tax=Roseicyclus mahoneyensis TaxID=164332 RepID=A0A316GPR7_9RHOB|nr:class II aldolase/adducin family protein [Roseicyclus mahoneyensis]PWK62401.1 L-fuculose-phosphate aldolase/L-ribulose-5-phosphate 4-epimerase [Roseicyclus mahoneyensis]
MADTARFPDLTDKMDALIATARRSFDLRLQTNAGGNLSVRLGAGNAIVIKPSGVGFAECTRDNLQVVLLDGTILPSELKPSKDLDFHLDLYRIRPDINAIVHCHSPWATGYASAGLEIPCLTVQTIEKIGRMPLIALSANGGPQTEVEISPVFRDPQIRAAVLANHGTIGVGKTLMAAQYLAEIIEETAHIAYVRDTLMAAHGRSTADLPRYGTAADARAAG